MRVRQTDARLEGLALAMRKGSKDIGFPLAQSIALAVKRHRQWRELTQRQVARKAQVAQSVVSEVENARDCSLKALYEISRSLGLRLSDLICLAEDMSDSRTVKEKVGAFLKSL